MQLLQAFFGFAQMAGVGNRIAFAIGEEVFQVPHQCPPVCQ